MIAIASCWRTNHPLLSRDVQRVLSSLNTPTSYFNVKVVCKERGGLPVCSEWTREVLETRSSETLFIHSHDRSENICAFVKS